MKAIIKALTIVAVQFLTDWKFPTFMAVLLATQAFIIATIGELKNYNDLAAIGDLQWNVIMLTGTLGAINALVGFFNTSFQRTRDAIADRNGGSDTTFFETPTTKPKNE